MLKKLLIGLTAIGLLAQPAIASDIIDLQDYPESTKPENLIIGKTCRTSTKVLPKPIESTECTKATVTGTSDTNPFLYFRFLDEYGMGYLYITDRFQNPNMTKIRLLGKIIDHQIVAVSADADGWCTVNAGNSEIKVKVACLIEGKQAMIMSLIEDFD
jgi:hypothetical protein